MKSQKSIPVLCLRLYFFDSMLDSFYGFEILNFGHVFNERIWNQYNEWLKIKDAMVIFETSLADTR